MTNNAKPTLEEYVEKYPDVSRFVILKIDTALRGINFTDKAFERARETDAILEISNTGTKNAKFTIGGIVFRDGTAARGLEEVQGRFPKIVRGHEGAPYTLDVVDDKLTLLDGDEPVEECFFKSRPGYYGKKTSRGTPMEDVVSAGRTDTLGVGGSFGVCQFWKEKLPCKYCNGVGSGLPRENRINGNTPEFLEDIYETVNEALKEKGRWTGFSAGGGSQPHSDNSPYEKEVDEYVKVLNTLKRIFGSKYIPIRLIASAFPEDQLIRLKEAGATAYEPHIEVWDEKLFEWICPGKSKYYGRQYWINSAIAAVDIFGKGNVCTQIVGGAEMAQPYGFKTIDDAVNSSLEGAEFYAQHGVSLSLHILRIGQTSYFSKIKHQAPPLEYYVRMAQGIRDIRRRYKIGADFNDYRRCSLHPDLDLSRLDYKNN
ncbi:MAG: radical SAM protein [Candidatus Methanoperedens sp.]|nr:radical SAM protein [Candidatus Methanoperedens sp.]